ncbi:hypothetical protein ACH5RR_030961 [Cinchona calisaya]|uniref:Transposase n=1 Tax=Cinchona calisaya TaxID=153742 RepID=A0ABD2YGY7_9GENT
MQEQLNEYWEDVFSVLAVATVMDPRCKMKYIEFLSLKYGNGSNCSQVTDVFVDIHNLYDEYMAHNTETESPISDSKNSDSDSDSEDLPEHIKQRCENPKFGFDCLDDYNEFIQSDIQPQNQKSDLECYLEEPLVPWSLNFNLLSWWGTLGRKYPILSKMARDLLAMQFSLVTDFDAYLY